MQVTDQLETKGRKKRVKGVNPRPTVAGERKGRGSVQYWHRGGVIGTRTQSAFNFSESVDDFVLSPS